MITRLKAWLLAKYSAGSTRASSWWANGIALMVAGLPDLINWAITYSDLITGAIPTLSDANKIRFLLTMNLAAWLLRMWKQNSVQKASLTQAAQQGLVTSAKGTDAVVVRAPDGAPVAIVRPADSAPDIPGV